MSAEEDTGIVENVGANVVVASTPVPLLLPVGMELDDLEREVNVLLVGVESVEDFQKIFEAIALPNPQVQANEEETPKRYYKVLLKHLVSDDVENSADKGMQVFLKIYNHLVIDQEDPPMPDVKPNPPLNSVQGKKSNQNGVLPSHNNNSFNSSGGVRRKPLFDVQKLQEFN